MHELRDDARHEAPRVGRRARGPSCGSEAGARHVLAQDRRLQRSQLRRRLDAEPVDERGVRGPVGVERIGLTPAAVEGEHLLAAQPLAQRMLVHERLELAGDLRVPAAGQVGVDAVAQAGEPQVLEPRDLRRGEALAADVRQRRAAPELERLAQRRRRLPRLAARQLLAAARGELLEALGVEFAVARRSA